MPAPAEHPDPSALRPALAVGTERLSAWADLLDQINVFPVADGDTGRNMLISLQPLKDVESPIDDLVEALLMAARGNSGNIAAQFFAGMLAAFDPDGLADAAGAGRDLAWKAVADPKPGTILSILDVLAEGLAGSGPEGGRGLEGLLDRLEEAVRETTAQLPALAKAGVVDSGALGMFIFLDGFLNIMHGRDGPFRPVAECFADGIRLVEGFEAEHEEGFCIDAVVRSADADALMAELKTMGESVVSMRRGDLVKLHLHTDAPDAVREKLRARADLLRFSSDDLMDQTVGFVRPGLNQALHLMTDAAGSVTREDALELGMTLLDSYVNLGTQSVPETHVLPADLYSAMQAGAAASTSQASDFERHQHYRKVLGLHPRVLYLCVGSVFTGNHQVALEWKKENDPEDRLRVIDSGAASGRLGLTALAVAKRALSTTDADEVVAFAERAVEACREWIFLDELKWLAAGGRLSKTSAFFGDLLHMKPVISPTPEGAKKVAVVRNRKAQVEFATARLDEAHASSGPGAILLEYTDNRSWVEGELMPVLVRRFAESQFQLRPVSLTSGVHMGPGTWAVAYLPLEVPAP